MPLYHNHMGLDSSVGIETPYLLHGLVIESQRRQLTILENTQMKNLCRATPGLVISVIKHDADLYNKIFYTLCVRGARCWWRSWLRHCATSKKVAGSIPDGVTGTFH